MVPIEITLSRYRYHFRPLTWQEELRLPFTPKVDQRVVVLSAALMDISGLVVTRKQAYEVLHQLPEAIVRRIWILYNSGLPEVRYYTSGALYEAPDAMTYRNRINDEQEATDAGAGRAFPATDRLSAWLRIRKRDSGPCRLQREEGSSQMNFHLIPEI